MKHYSEEHEWVEIQGDIAIVGVSSHASDELGDVTYVEFPEIGAEFSQGDTMLVVESVKAASDVFAPVSGRVVAVNNALADRPELINESPEEDGWICRLEGFDERELENLMTYDEYQEYIGE